MYFIFNFIILFLFYAYVIFTLFYFIFILRREKTTRWSRAQGTRGRLKGGSRGTKARLRSRCQRGRNFKTDRVFLLLFSSLSPLFTSLSSLFRPLAHFLFWVLSLARHLTTLHFPSTKTFHQVQPALPGYETRSPRKSCGPTFRACHLLRKRFEYCFSWENKRRATVSNQGKTQLRWKTEVLILLENVEISENWVS